MEYSRRKARRDRHRRGTGTPTEQSPRNFATAGQERDALPRSDAARDPKTLTDFDPAYGKTYSAESQPRGGQAPYERQTCGNQGSSDAPDESSGPEAGSGASGFGREYGQGFGVGAGHGVESAGQGLEGSPRERDYRGNAGTTFGATVGPDALKQDTAADKREDRKPDAEE
jgi:hypothetical protein